MAKQECAKTKDGRFNASVGRLEQGYYSMYVEKKMELASTTEALLATSWGVWQLMGLSLFELKYFEWYFKNIPSAEWREKVLYTGHTPLAVTEAINYFAVNLDLQCEYACKLLAVKRNIGEKMQNFKGETDPLRKMLLLWNGGGNLKYDDEVMEKMKGEPA